MTVKKNTTAATPFTDRQLLEEINKKLDIIIDGFGFLDGKSGKKARETSAEIEAWAKDTIEKYRKRIEKKKRSNGK
jgi:hypothetical protein